MYNKILAPLDGSNVAECALEHVKAVASGCRVPEVVLLTVLEPVLFPLFYPTSEAQVNKASAEMDEKMKQIHQKAESYLSSAADRLKQAGLAVTTVVIEERGGKRAAELILDYAQNKAVDLIVISTHGRSGASRWAFGSVADNVVRHSQVPVLTVAPAGCRLPPVT
jgi:nucleotide-binding universal stress UspA family protein